MGALDAGLDLGALAGCYVAIGLAAILLILLEELDTVLRISVLGLHPFAGLANALENTLIRGLRAAIGFFEARAAEFESGLIDSLALLIATPILLAEGIYKALEYGWAAVTRPLLNELGDLAQTTSERLDAAVRRLDGKIAAAATAAKVAAGDQIKEAGLAFTSYSDAAAGAAGRAAELYADRAVKKLGDAEELALQGANASLLAAGKAITGLERRIADELAPAVGAEGAVIARLEGALAHEIRPALRSVGQAITALESDLPLIGETAATALAKASAAATEAAFEQVKSIAITAERDIRDLVGDQGILGTAALIAAVPAIATLVHAIASEAGLGRAECRQKVGKVCQTDPTAWGELLGGLALLGFGFSLRELAELARPLVHELAPIVREAA